MVRNSAMNALVGVAVARGIFHLKNHRIVWSRRAWNFGVCVFLLSLLGICGIFPSWPTGECIYCSYWKEREREADDRSVQIRVSKSVATNRNPCRICEANLKRIHSEIRFMNKIQLEGWIAIKIINPFKKKTHKKTNITFFLYFASSSISLCIISGLDSFLLMIYFY